MATQIKLRRDTAANWTSANPILALGEAGVDTTNNQIRIGDGTNTWSLLSPIGGAGGATELDGLTDVSVVGSAAGFLLQDDGDGTYSFTNALSGVASVAAAGASNLNLQNSLGNVLIQINDTGTTLHKPNGETVLTINNGGDVVPGGYWNFPGFGSTSNFSASGRITAKHYETNINPQTYVGGEFLVADPTFGGIWDVTASGNFTMDPPATVGVNNGDHMDIYITVAQAGNVVMTNNSGMQWLGGVAGRAPNTTETTNGAATSHIRLIRLNSTWFGEFVGVFYTP